VFDFGDAGSRFDGIEYAEFQIATIQSRRFEVTGERGKHDWRLTPTRQFPSGHVVRDRGSVASEEVEKVILRVFAYRMQNVTVWNVRRVGSGRIFDENE
jgi:hypothetical protein